MNPEPQPTKQAEEAAIKPWTFIRSIGHVSQCEVLRPDGSFFVYVDGSAWAQLVVDTLNELSGRRAIEPLKEPPISAQFIEAAKALRAEYAATDEYVEHSPTHKLLAAFDTALSSLEARQTSDLFCVHGVPLSQRCTSCNPPAPSTQAEVEPTIDEIGRAGSDVESRVWRINALIKRAVGVRVLVPCSRESESPDILDQTGKRLFMAFWGTHPPTPEATSAEEDRIYSLIEAVCGMWNVWPRLMDSAAYRSREKAPAEDEARLPHFDCREATIEEIAAMIQEQGVFDYECFASGAPDTFAMWGHTHLSMADRVRDQKNAPRSASAFEAVRHLPIKRHPYVEPAALASRQPSVDRDAVVEECAAAIENGDLLEVLEGKPRMISETEAKLRTAEALTSAAALLRALKAPRAEAETPMRPDLTIVYESHYRSSLDRDGAWCSTCDGYYLHSKCARCNRYACDRHRHECEVEKPKEDKCPTPKQ